MGTQPLNSRDGHTSVVTVRGKATGVTSWRDGSVVASIELLAACRTGDQEAWELLVGRYERLVFSVALRNGVTREEAADVTQMTFIALLESVARLRDDQRLASWLMSVAAGWHGGSDGVATGSAFPSSR